MAELGVPPEDDETQKSLGSVEFDIGYDPPVIRESYRDAKPSGYEDHKRARRRIADQSRKRNRRSR